MTWTLPHCSSGRRRRSNASNSPEFEFWMVRNPTLPQSDLLSADELFVDGVLLPLRLRHFHPNYQPSGEPPDDLVSETTETASTSANSAAKPVLESGLGSGPELSTSPPDTSAPALTGSKRWIDIFKKTDRKNSKGNEEREREKREKKERKVGSGAGAGTAELNINIWPFSRSRSAGNGGTRPRMAAGSASTRKVSSAPCSRSNSAGESKARKWPSSPSRVGVHLGRSSPVWQVRRRNPDPTVVRNVEKGGQKEGNEARRKKLSAAVGVRGGTGVTRGGNKARVLNLNVPMCIGYRQHLSCRSDESSAVSVDVGGGGTAGQGRGGSGSGVGGRGINLFSLRSIFTKKVY
ncbi:hypothetical protein NMG60_11009884 [Bertholletia excelsa]